MNIRIAGIYMKFHTKRVFLICSSGGHLTQMLRLNMALMGYSVSLVTEETVVSKALNEPSLDEIILY